MRKKMIETSYGEYELYINNCEGDCLFCRQCPLGQRVVEFYHQEVELNDVS